MTRRRVVVGVASAAVVAAVGGAVVLGATPLGDGLRPPPVPSSPSAAPSPSPSPTPVATWPLTGLPADTRPTGPVLVVKVDDTEGGRPQVGVGSADLVVQELVEGGLTRLAVMVHSQLAEQRPRSSDLVIGPVRSLRASDAGFAGPLDPVIVAAGGAPQARAAAAAADLRLVGEEDPSLSRSSERPAPYNLFLDAEALRDSLGAERAPDDYLPWGAAPPPTRPVDRVALQFSVASTTEFRRDATGGWRRAGDSTVAPRFVADTLVALRVRLVDAGYLDPAGNPVPEILTTGTGTGWLVTGGDATRIRWAKGDPADPWRFTTADGKRAAVPPGRVWLALVPTEGGKVRLDTKQPR